MPKCLTSRDTGKSKKKIKRVRFAQDLKPTEILESMLKRVRVKGKSKVKSILKKKRV